MERVSQLDCGVPWILWADRYIIAVSQAVKQPSGLQRRAFL